MSVQPMTKRNRLMRVSTDNTARLPPAHPLVIRITHWVGATAMIGMIASGWQIYNASPILPFVFPRFLTLGGWLAGAIAWHLAAMWVLLADGAVYLAYGLLSGHFRRDFAPITPGELWRDVWNAMRFRLGHRLGHYNSVQKILYVGVLAVALLTVATGMAIWKPVQLGWLTGLFGGYPTARVIHFGLMSAIVAFLVVHVTLALIYPATIRSMLGGRARQSVS